MKVVREGGVVLAQRQKQGVRHQITQAFFFGDEAVTALAVDHADGTEQIAPGVVADAPPGGALGRVQFGDFALVDHKDELAGLPCIEDHVIPPVVGDIQPAQDPLALGLVEQ